MLGVQVCRRSLGVEIRGSKPEKPGFHLSSCNMQLLANDCTGHQYVYLMVTLSP